TCAITVEVGAAIASGGASLEVGTAVMASDGAYQALLKQIDRSGADPKFSLADGVMNVLAGAAVGALTNALVGNAGFMEDLTEKLASKMEASVLKRFGKELAAKVASKIVKAEITGLVGTAVSDLVKSCKPGSKMTLTQAAEDVAKTMLASAALGGALSGLDKQLDGLSDKGATYFKPGVFKGLGEVDPKKAFAAGGDQIVEQAVKRLGPKLILEAASAPKSLAQIGKELAAEIAHDAKVNAEMAELVKKRKLH
ncbi:MAG: hypothetical protein KGI51_08075, partial [Rhodospirillales bacterium]|nr:hypothetical protein [Rhodospirillales bacterium]